jgi:sugar phosphate isomerase/epimerase
MYACLNGVTAGGGLPLKEFIELAADTGFQGVEASIDAIARLAAETSLANVKDLFASNGIQPGASGLPVEFRKDEAALEDGLKRLPDLAKMAREFGITRMCTWLSPSSDMPYDERWQFMVSRLQPVVDILRAEGLHFGIEFVGPKTSRQGPHDFLYTMEEALKLGEDLGGDYCGLLLDSFHWFCSESTTAAIEALPAEKIVNVHINDAPDRPVDEQIDFERLLPGEGIIDLDGFLGALRKIGYAGPVSVEVFSDDLKKLPAEEAAKRAADATLGVLARSA